MPLFIPALYILGAGTALLALTSCNEKKKAPVLDEKTARGPARKIYDQLLEAEVKPKAMDLPGRNGQPRDGVIRENELFNTTQDLLKKQPGNKKLKKIVKETFPEVAKEHLKFAKGAFATPEKTKSFSEYSSTDLRKICRGKSRYKTALRYDSSNFQANFLNGICEPDPAKAEKFFWRARGTDAESVEAYHQLGNVLYFQGNIKDAVQAYETALKLDPNKAESRMRLGMIYAETNPKLAIRYLETAASVPDKEPNPAALVNLALLLDSQGEYQRASKYYDIIQPKFEPEQEGGAEDYSELAQAYRQYHADRILPMDPDSFKGNMVAPWPSQVMFYHDRITTAIRHYEAAVRADPDNAENHFRLGYLKMHLTKDKEAMESFRNAIEVNPQMIQAHIFLANALKKKGKRDEALQVLQEAQFNSSHDHELIHLHWAQRTIENSIGDR